MVKELTFLEDVESIMIDILMQGAVILIGAMVALCLLAHFSVWTVGITAVLAYVVGFVWKTIRYGERSARVVDRIVKLEIGVSNLVDSVNHAVDTIKDVLGGKEKPENILNV